MECERDQLKSSVDSVRTYHTEELVARDKSHRLGKINVCIFHFVLMYIHYLLVTEYKHWKSPFREEKKSMYVLQYVYTCTCIYMYMLAKACVVACVCTCICRWKEELEVQSTHQRERLEQLERDKVDSVLALRKKMESLELAKTNDMAQLQETHRWAFILTPHTE